MKTLRILDWTTKDGIPINWQYWKQWDWGLWRQKLRCLQVHIGHLKDASKNPHGEVKWIEIHIHKHTWKETWSEKLLLTAKGWYLKTWNWMKSSDSEKVQCFFFLWCTPILKAHGNESVSPTDWVEKPKSYSKTSTACRSRQWRNISRSWVNSIRSKWAMIIDF